MRLWKKSVDAADPKPCVSCKGTDVELSTVAKCMGCGYKVYLNATESCTLVNLRRRWNGERDRLKAELRAIKKRIGELRKLGIY